MSGNLSAVNALTAGWLERSGGGVLSGAGLWPLLAFLAASADAPGRAELSAAVGVPAADCMDAARDVLDVLDGLSGVDAALGLWAQEDAEVRAEWMRDVPPGVLGRLTGDSAVDRAALDQWAYERTGGLIERFPVDSGPRTMLILATALAVRTTWTDAFTDGLLAPRGGAWAGRRLAGLNRTTPGLDDLRLASTPVGPLAVTRVAGDNGLDVHLVLGPEDGPENGPEGGPERGSIGATLAAAMSVVSGAIASITGDQLLDHGDPASWPGLSLVPALRRSLEVYTARFALNSDHDLLEHAGVFGMSTVSQPGRGHFSTISPVPLWVDQARQSTVAVFTAVGFEAAAVTAVGLRTVSLRTSDATALRVSYDRPFGFLAVHRGTGLVLFAGWVDSPDEFRRG